MSEVREQPLVSVVVIFLDAARFLAEAVESVLAQTYPRWELLLVDDGSRDASPRIALEYAARLPGRVRYLTHPGRANRGMSASRNLGMRAAGGEYLAFLDADDAWGETALQEQVEILEARPQVGMVYGPLLWWYSWTGAPEDRQRDYVESLGVPPDEVVEPPALLPVFLRDRGAVPSGFLVRRQAAARVGGFEEAFRGEYEDQVFCVKICLAERVFASGRCWYRYRQHPDSCVAVAHRTGASARARRIFLRWVAGYFIRQGVWSPALWRVLHQELWATTGKPWRRLSRQAHGVVRRGARRVRRAVRG